MSNALIPIVLIVGVATVAVVGSATFAVAVRILQSSRRSEDLGEDRYELLRDQHDRLELLREERQRLIEELERESQERQRLLELLESFGEGQLPPLGDLKQQRGKRPVNQPENAKTEPK